ncbi:MAG: peptidylprolyl isomerase [Candidatus Hydrogenedentes bacterium]|nr:peptidylprolyl isomerase [Candidatus Hydrogenedentota bacterium]
MSSEFEPVAAEPKDRTKWIWLGVVLLVLAMGIAMWKFGGPNPNVSKARARHIFVACNLNDPADRDRALKLIADLRSRILNGESFATLAEEYSNDPATSARGGDLGWAGRGDMEDSFDEYLWKGNLNEISDIIRTSRGFHLIEIRERYISAADQYEMELQRRARSGTSGETSSTSESPPPTDSNTPATPGPARP